MSRTWSLYSSRLPNVISTHFMYVMTAVSIAFVVAFFLGILLSRTPKKGANIILTVISVFQTIPGIVFIGILFIYNGMVPSTVIFALTIYAIFPILKNTYVGIISVSEEYKDAAKGCGMSTIQILAKVEIPLALPAIINGLRLSTVYTVSWTVLAAMIGLGGLGELIYTGVNSNNHSLILLGAIPAATMAITLSMAIDLLRKALIPKQIRRDIK